MARVRCMHVHAVARCTGNTLYDDKPPGEDEKGCIWAHTQVQDTLHAAEKLG